ncbi:MAG: transglycosylase domain-containing protein [Acidobacteriota bacterium]|nr:transglycosylase domain-containing protein [Acidobacteriota bacterium]
MKTEHQFTAYFLLLVCVASSYLTYTSNRTVEANKELIKNNRVTQDVIIYAEPEFLRVGDDMEAMANRLFIRTDVINSSATCKDINQDKSVTFSQLPPRAYCLNIRNGFIRQVPPLPSYVFNLKMTNKKPIVTEIFDESGNSVSEAEIYFNPKVIFKINAQGEVEEQVRQRLLLNRSNLELDGIKFLLQLEGSRTYETWNQGTDFVGLTRAAAQSGLKIVGLGGDNFQGASTPFEQYAKIALIDTKNPPTSTKPTQRREENAEAATYWETACEFFERKWDLLLKLKRRVASAYLAQALLEHFTKDEIVLRWASETNFGTEMTEVKNGKLSHADQTKETIRGYSAAAHAFFNKPKIEDLTPIEQATLAIAPREPALLKILQKKPAKRTASENQKLVNRSRKYLNRIKKALLAYAEKLESEGRTEQAKKYRGASEKIPTTPTENSEYRIGRYFKKLFNLAPAPAEPSEAELIGKLEEFKALIPALRINEDDKLSSENLQIMEREALREEVSKIIADKKLTYAQLKDLKITVVTSTISSLQSDLANLIETGRLTAENKGEDVSISKIKKLLDEKISSKKNPFPFDLLVESVVSDETGRVAASVATRFERDRIIPNRLYVNYPTFLGSIAKIINVTAALDARKVSLDTEVCSSQARSPNGYVFEEMPEPEECMTIGEGLQRSRNWIQIIVRNAVGNDLALDYWKKASNQEIQYPEDFNIRTQLEKDKWFYEQTRGVNGVPVSKSVIDAVGMFTPMANEGTRSKPTFIKKFWIGNNLSQIASEQTLVFNPNSVAEVSALMQENGKTAFNLGEESPAVKTGSISNAYWNAVWSRNLVLVSRVTIMMPKDEDIENKIQSIKTTLKAEREKYLIDKQVISQYESELKRLNDEKKKKQEDFLVLLGKKSTEVFAKDIVQPFNQRVVELIYLKHKYFFREPN